MQTASTARCAQNFAAIPKTMQAMPRNMLPNTQIMTGTLFLATMVGFDQSYLGNL